MAETVLTPEEQGAVARVMRDLGSAASLSRTSVAWRRRLLKIIERLLLLVDRQRVVIDKARRGAKAVRTLMSESRGVDGLHLNGDIADWYELEGDGRYCEWLADFNKLEAAIAALDQPTAAGEGR